MKKAGETCPFGLLEESFYYGRTTEPFLLITLKPEK